MNYTPTKKLGQKDRLDKFYTTEKNVDFCLSLIDLSEYDCIIDPSAGAGAFSSKIPECFAYDIEPDAEKIINADWLNLNKDIFGKYKNILVIGNPPFGQQNKLALDFINESAKFCNTIAFILPKSFKKQSIQNRINLNFSLSKERELIEDNFILKGKNYSVPCIFQIWERSSEKRAIPKKKMESKYIDFVTSDKADFRVQRVGGNAGIASFDLNKAKSSNYFIKNKTNVDNSKLVDFINKLDFPSISFTVGPKSLPKSELIQVLEENILDL